MPDTSTWHRITVADPARRLGDCSVCGPGVRLRRRERRGTVEWSCMSRHREWPSVPKHRQAIGTRPWCERCGFLAAHRSQLDVHHRDENHDNNDPANLEVLCANCHRLEHVNPAAVEGRPVTVHQVRYEIEVRGMRMAMWQAGLDVPSIERLAELARLYYEIADAEAAA